MRSESVTVGIFPFPDPADDYFRRCPGKSIYGSQILYNNIMIHPACFRIKKLRVSLAKPEILRKATESRVAMQRDAQSRAWRSLPSINGCMRSQEECEHGPADKFEHQRSRDNYEKQSHY